MSQSESSSLKQNKRPLSFPEREPPKQPRQDGTDYYGQGNEVTTGVLELRFM